MKIEINTKRILNKISPLLYGVFFEDINYGGDGGLYAELVANRSFEYYDRDTKTDKHKMCWESVGGAEFEVGTLNPLNDTHTHYASVRGDSGSGIKNIGYGGEGFGVSENEEFVFSCYARAKGDTKIRAVITDGENRVLCDGEFSVKSGEWVKHELCLKARGKCKRAHLSVTLCEGGEVDLEFISLFPKDTFMGRRNGMRRDIAEAIADLKPRFMRFPGGCIVEGRSFDNMYNWKDTVGPVEERRTNRNRWQMEEYRNLGYDASDYFQSYGLGFYEYFQFCEDIGAKCVPVINCGMTCQWHEGLLVDTDELLPYVHDALDLIEFANGSAQTKWGGLRARMGHEEPFNLEYIGIGNEQWGEEYFERYEIFWKCISEKYPDIKLITSAGWKDRGWEYDTAYAWMEKNKDKAYAVDEHFYKEPEWFLENIHRYDKYDRTLPKVFIGEWAAHTDRDIELRENNWYAALCEAAFLTGVEENGDHVVMTCYAPLLARYEHQQWQPNLIWFDNEGVCLTPSYLVQKMFSENLGDYTVEAVCHDADLKITASVTDAELILKIVNVTGEDKRAEIFADIDLGKEYTVIKTAAPLEAANSPKNPEAVKAAVSSETWTGTYNADAYSVSVLRFKL